MAELTDDQKRLKDFTKRKLQEKWVIDSPAGTSNLTNEQENLVDWTKNKLAERSQNIRNQTTVGTILPWISNYVNSYEWWIRQDNINTNIPLPWITSDIYKKTVDKVSPATEKQIKEWSKQASKDDVDKKSWNEKITRGRYADETIPLLKQGIKQWRNDIKKRTYRAVIEFVDDPWDYIQSIIPFRWGTKLFLDSIPWASDEAVNNMWKNYYKYENKINKSFEEWTKKNIDQKLAEEYAEKWLWNSIMEWDLNNSMYWLTQAFGSSILPMLPWLVVWFISKNPWLLSLAWYLPAEAVENQSAYDEAIALWATREEATKIWETAWKLNGTLEIIWEIFQLKPILKPLKNNVTRNVTRIVRKWSLRMGADWLFGFSKWVLWEAGTEWLQELITNSLLDTIEWVDIDLFEWVLDSIIAWWFIWAPWSFLWATWKTIKTSEENKKADLVNEMIDKEALEYVMEWEERKNQRMQQKQELALAKERIKARIMQNRKNPTMDNGYTPSPEQAEQREQEKQENEEYEDELRSEQNRENSLTEPSQEDQAQWGKEWIESRQQEEELRAENNKNVSIENEMMNEVLNDNIHEDLWDPRYQKIEDDIEDIKNSLENMDDNTFFDRIMSSINKDWKRNFAVYNNNWQKSVLRVVKRGGAKWKNQTVTIQVMKPSKKSGKVTMSQWTYNPWNLTVQQRQWIIEWIQNWWNTGEFSIWDAKYQWWVKYEEEWYIPWRAMKWEKSISWQEWVNVRSKINKRTIREFAEKYGIKVEVIEWMIKVLENGVWNGEYAYGKYVDNLLTLSEQIKESTAPHELLHAIFDMIDPETKTYLISQVMKSEGWSAKQAEEWLADSFSNFFRTGKIEWAPKSTWWKIKIFFKKVRAFINGLWKWRTQLEDIFTNIITAEGIEDLQSKIDRDTSLEKAKARMRERFMEYRKNAIKMQKKAESENKFQKKQKDEPRSLTDIKSVRTTDSSLPNSITIDDENSSAILDNLNFLVNAVKDNAI